MCKTRTALEATTDKEAKQLAGKQQAKQVESIDKDTAETFLPAVSNSFNHALPATFEPVSSDNRPEKAVLSDYTETPPPHPPERVETDDYRYHPQSILKFLHNFYN